MKTHHTNHAPTCVTCGKEISFDHGSGRWDGFLDGDMNFHVHLRCRGRFYKFKEATPYKRQKKEMPIFVREAKTVP